MYKYTDSLVFSQLMIPFYTCSSSLTLSNSFQLLLQNHPLHATHIHIQVNTKSRLRGAREIERGRDDLSIERAVARGNAIEEARARARETRKGRKRQRAGASGRGAGPCARETRATLQCSGTSLFTVRLPTTRATIPGTWDRGSSLGLSVCVCVFGFGDVDSSKS